MADRPRLARPVTGAGGVSGVALTLGAALGLGIGTALGWGVVALAAVGLAWLYWFIGVRWQRGFYGLLIYLPFAGVVTLALYPWPAPLLFKDVLFVVPAYVGFLVALARGPHALRGLPRVPSSLLVALGVLALVQMVNPGVENLLMALIGLKVWTLYLPLFVLAFVVVSTEEEVFRLFRLLAALSLIPCAIGIIEVVLVQVSGYEATMEALYGEAAANATQRFAAFDIEGGVLARIPSTFTFGTQYFGYTIAMIAPCYAVWRRDSSWRWRHLGGVALTAVSIASLLSGARAAFVFVPLLLALTFGLERGFAGLARSGVYAVGIIGLALAVLGIGGGALYSHVSELAGGYATDIAYGGLVQAITSAPLGTGTGTNTGPARYAFADPQAFTAIENYYAKVVYELGLEGLVVVVGLWASLIVIGGRIHRRLRGRPLRSCSAALLAFVILIAVTNVKGWLVDLDPLNVYVWVFAGVLMKLGVFEARSSPAEVG